MSCLRFLSLLGVSLGAIAGLPTAPHELFNGVDLEGWVFHSEAGEQAPEAVGRVTAEGFLRLASEEEGYLRTTEVFQNYRLIVEWRWPERAGNSGVLLHGQGPARVWPLCFQAQLQSSRAGDLVATGVGSGGTFHEGAVLVTDPAHPYYASKRRHPSSENPRGEWNRLEVIADGTELRLLVNDVEQNAARDLRLTSGFIGLQTEGTPIEFRRLTLEPLPR